MDEIIPCSSQVHNSIWAPSSPPSFHASASMVNFEDSPEAHNSQRQFVEQVDGKVETHDSEYDKHFHQPDKKKRLAPTQVQYLEKSFEVENKLEPDRKIHLAKELGLQPRQVAIWFQNRRARCKTKVLEKEYDSLKGRYDKLKADYETLFTENEKLKNEVHLLRKKLKPKTEPCDHHTIFDYQPKKNQISSQEDDDDDDDDALNVVHEVVYKQDDAASSAKSDVLDSDSPRYSSNVFDSDFSQDEDESLRTLLQLPKIEVECYDDLQPNSCNFGFPVQDQGTWVWKY